MIYFNPITINSGPTSGSTRVFENPGYNLIEGFPRQCWEQGVISVPFLGSKLVLVNSPEAIREMMVTKADHFGRLSAGRRVLSPVVGSGLALSEGTDWKRQRRMLAPAFGPRSTPVIATLVVRATNMAVNRLKLRSDRDTADLFGEFRPSRPGNRCSGLVLDVERAPRLSDTRHDGYIRRKHRSSSCRGLYLAALGSDAGSNTQDTFPATLDAVDRYRYSRASRNLRAG
jgi:cytochrome P450